MRTRVIAHRGASVEAPENTMLAFERAIEVGADMIELDVRRTRDGELVVIHDATIDRTTDGTGAVADLTWTELRNSRIRWNGETQKTPLLREVLEAARGRVGLNIEIKKSPAVAEMVDPLLSLIDATSFPISELIISCFDSSFLKQIEQKRSDIEVAPLFKVFSGETDNLPGRWIHLHFGQVSRESMELFRSAGRKVNVWTVNDPEEQERLMSLGVDGIITDDPGGLRRRLEE